MKKKNKRLGDLNSDSLDQHLRDIKTRKRFGCSGILDALEEVSAFGQRTLHVAGGEFFTSYEGEVMRLKEKLREAAQSTCCARPSTPARYRAGKKK